MQEGWVKITRKMLGSPIMSHDGLTRLWMLCLLKANWKDRKWLIPGTTNEMLVPRGSFVTGRSKLHSKLYGADYSGDKKAIPSELTLWRWLKRLEKMGCIRVTNVNNRCSMVTICKYSTYQKREDPKRTTGEQPVNNRRTTDEQLMNTIEERKNLRREELNTCSLGKAENEKPEPKPEPTPPFAGERPGFDLGMIPIPDVLRVPRFLEAWAKWYRYLTADKGQRFSQATAEAQLASMARDGPAVAIHRIEASIEAGWIKLADKPQDKPQNGKQKRKFITAAESIGSEFDKRL
jgi:hypothetical protein